MNIEFENLKVNPDIMTCFVNGNDIHLTKTEYELLLHFLGKRNKVFSRKELSNDVWNKDETSRTIDTTVSRLRKKLGKVGDHIITKNGFGYGFVE